MSSDVSSTNDAIPSNDEEVQKKKLPYPKSVFFIISNEFCERFSYYGMRTILTIYLTDILLFNNKDATVIYHAFACLVYFFPVLGAIISDSWWGKFNTIFYLSIVYAVGGILLALSSAKPVGLPQVPFTMIGLVLIAMGTGGIKPCVSAFGGDQFKLPEQEVQLAMFFSLFYFSINSGSLISTFLTPVLRNMPCLGEDSCFPVAYAVPSALMIVSIVIFALGKPLYKIKAPQGNVLVNVGKCIYHAATSKKGNEAHWLDRSVDRFGEQMVFEVKATLKVLVLYIPLPIFWSLYDQQGSVWTIQATQLDGKLGSWTILPDQIQVVNPLLILAFIPLFSYGVYPLLNKCHLVRTPLQKMVCGGLLAAVAFGLSAVISTFIENGQAVVPDEGHVDLRLYNPTECSYLIGAEGIKGPTLKSLNAFSYQEFKNIEMEETVTFTITSNTPGCTVTSSPFKGKANDADAYVFYVNHDKTFYFGNDTIALTATDPPYLRTLSKSGHDVKYKKGDNEITVQQDFVMANLSEAGQYEIILDGNVVSTETFETGGIYTVLVDTKKVTVVEVSRATTIHMLWQLPQYVIITAAEIMFSITGIEFSYSQAPVNMKSVLQAAFLLTTAIGDVIIIIIESIEIFPQQSYVLLLFAGLMILDMVLFGYLAYRYKYVQLYDNSEADTELEDQNEKKISGGLDNPVFKSPEGEVKKTSDELDNTELEEPKNDST